MSTRASSPVLRRRARQVTRGVGGGALTWPGLLRRLDRENPGYGD